MQFFFSCSLRKEGGLCCALSLLLLGPFPPRQGAVYCIWCTMLFPLPSMEFLDSFACNMFCSNAHPRKLLWPLSPSLRVDTPGLSSVCGHALPHGVSFASHAWDFSASSMPNTLLVSQGCLLELIWSKFLLQYSRDLEQILLAQCCRWGTWAQRLWVRHWGLVETGEAVHKFLSLKA